MLSQYRNPSFNKQELKALIKENLNQDFSDAKLKALKSKALKDKNLEISFRDYYHTQETSIKSAINITYSLKKLFKEQGLSMTEILQFLPIFSRNSPISTHYDTFLPMLKVLVDTQTFENFVAQCEKSNFFGCVALCELENAPNYDSIETLAEYCEKNKKFIINSPTITSTKWLIHNLSPITTHLIINAKVLIKKRLLGHHLFLIQIRDPRDLTLFEGIEIENLGPMSKNNFTSISSLRFFRFSVPENCLLTSKTWENSHTSERFNLDHEICKIQANKLNQNWRSLCMCLIITIRYSFIREQFQGHGKISNKRVIDYPIQQYKVFSALSVLYCHIFSFRYVNLICNRLLIDSDHLKVKNHFILDLFVFGKNMEISKAIEECRRSCGAHGYLMISGLPSLYLNFTELFVITEQESLKIIKTFQTFIKTFRKNEKILEDFEFLYTENVKKYKNNEYQNWIEEVAQKGIMKLLEKEQKLLEKGLSSDHIWKYEIQSQALEVCEMIFYAIFHRIYCEGVSKVKDSNLKSILNELINIYAVNMIEKFQANIDCLRLSPEKFTEIKESQIKSLSVIRRDALPLIESFEILDESLNSVLSHRDGKIYQNIVWSSKYGNLLNKHKVFPGLFSKNQPKI